MSGSLIIFLTACVTIAHAQFSFLKKVDEFGVTFGPGVVSFRSAGIYHDGQHPKAIQNFGIDIKWSARNPRLMLDIKVLIERLGNSTSGPHGGYINNDSTNYVTGSRDVTYDLNYLTMPVSVHYRFLKNMRLYVSAGMFGGYFIKGKLTIEEVLGNERKTHTYYDFSKDIKDYNFGGTAGIGYKLLQKENFSLSLELTGRLGFVDLNTHNFNKPDPVRTQALAFTVLLSTSVNRSKIN